MINLKPIERIVMVVLASGKLEDERPLSLLIIAPVEAGKSSLIRKFTLCVDSVFYTTDATAYGIIRDTDNLKKFQTGELTHIVIPDLLMCVSRKRDTVKTFIHFMNALTEEGVVNISTYAVRLRENEEPVKKGIKAGLITAIPPEPLSDKRRHWERIGFLSRAIPVSYSYQPSTVCSILEYIEKEEHLRGLLLEEIIPYQRPNSESRLML